MQKTTLIKCDRSSTVMEVRDAGECIKDREYVELVIYQRTGIPLKERFKICAKIMFDGILPYQSILLTRSKGYALMQDLHAIVSRFTFNFNEK